MTKLLGNEYEITRFRLREWLELEAINFELKRAVDDKDRNEIQNFICEYVSTALDISEDISHLPWFEVVKIYEEILKVNHVKTNLPYLRYPPKDTEQVPWDYKKRLWWEWAHIFAKEYTWSLEYVADLEVETALHLFQEIIVDRQLEREWEWGLSENSIVYNSSTKKSEFKPLERPAWMIKPPTPIKKIKMLKAFMPVGNIISGDKDKILND